MKDILIVIGVALLTASLASAAPCAVGANVLSLGTCDFGGLTFSDWDVDVSGFTSASVFFGSGSEVTPTGVNVEFQVTTNPLEAPAGGGDILLRYMVTGSLLGVDLALGSVFGDVGIIENVCADDPQVGGCGTSLAQLSVTNGGTTYAAVTFASPVNQAWITKDISLNEGGKISDFINSHEVPEPMTYLLMGSGLLALGLLRRKITKS